MNCYYHRDYLNKEVELPIGHMPYGFCNEEEHELWADKTYGEKGNKPEAKSVAYMQKRLKELAKEEHTKGNYR